MNEKSRPRPLSAFSEHMGFEVVERSEDGSVIECVVSPQHANTRGVVHGGVLSALIDMACGVAVAYQPSYGGRAAVSVSMTVNYLQPAMVGDRLRAVAKRARSGRRIVACEAAIYTQTGAMVAMGIATMRVIGEP